MAAFTSRHRARAFALAAILGLSAAACQARDGQTGTGSASYDAPSVAAFPNPVGDSAVQALLANVEAARSRHDARALHQFRAQLRSKLGEAAIERADAAYRQVVSNLTAARAAHDAKARAGFRAELRAMCEPPSLTSAIEPCDGIAEAAG